MYRNNIDGGMFDNKEDAHMDSIQSAIYELKEDMLDDKCYAKGEESGLKEALLDIRSSCKQLIRAIEGKEISEFKLVK